jgi:hypothetical protein
LEFIVGTYPGPNSEIKNEPTIAFLTLYVSTYVVNVLATEFGPPKIPVGCAIALLYIAYEVGLFFYYIVYVIIPTEAGS